MVMRRLDIDSAAGALSHDATQLARAGRAPAAATASTPASRDSTCEARDEGKDVVSGEPRRPGGHDRLETWPAFTGRKPGMEAVVPTEALGRPP